MKRLMYMSVAAGLMFAACNKEDSTSNPGEKQYKVAAYSDVEITGNVVVEKKKDREPGTVTVKGNPELIAAFEVRSEGDVLYIEANSGAELNDSIYVEIGDADIDVITLNAQQQAVFRWVDDDRDALENLKIYTRGGSKLWFHGLRSERVDVDMAGNSFVYFDTYMGDVDEDTVWVAKSHAQLKGDFLIIDRDSNSTYEVAYAVNGAVINTDTKDNVEYYVISDADVDMFYLIENVNIMTAGTADIEAMDAAILNLNANLKGNSTGEFWVLGSISGEGNGSSILNYIGDPNITYSLIGSASILKL